MGCADRSGGARGSGYIYVVERVAGGTLRNPGELLEPRRGDGTVRNGNRRTCGLGGYAKAPRGLRGSSRAGRTVRTAFVSKTRGLAALALGLVIVVSVILAIAQAVSGVERVYTDVVVKPGDTLWGIAERASDGQRDLRALVDQIREINGLGSVVLRPGQTLKVPCYR